MKIHKGTDTRSQTISLSKPMPKEHNDAESERIYRDDARKIYARLEETLPYGTWEKLVNLCFDEHEQMKTQLHSIILRAVARRQNNDHS